MTETRKIPNKKPLRELVARAIYASQGCPIDSAGVWYEIVNDKKVVMDGFEKWYVMADAAIKAVRKYNRKRGR
jgi:hypothetical protein